MIRSSTNLCSACRPLHRFQPSTPTLPSPLLRTTTRSFNSISIQQAAASRRTVGLKSKKVFKRPALATSVIEKEKEVGTVVGDGSTGGVHKVTSIEKEGNTATIPEASYPWNAYNASPPIPSSSTLVSESSPSSTDITPSEPQPIPVALIPVQVPHDPHGVLDLSTSDWSLKARRLLAVSGIVVVRQLEMMNVLLGYEEANKYQLLSPEGVLLGYLMEEEVGMKGMVMRQMLKTHRAFKATVLDIDGEVILRIRRPFSFINSRIYVTAPSIPSSSTPSSSSPLEIPDQETIIGEAQQEWHLYRRKYNHFVKRGEESVQFGVTDSGLMAWDFEVRNESNEVIGSINRNFAGFGRELFTDTGQYVLRFEGVASEQLAIAEAAKPTSEALPPPPLSTSPSPSTLKSDLTITSNTQTSPSTNDSAIVPSSNPTDILSSVPALSIPSITYDQRAVMLGAAVSIDFDYFTRSRGGVGGMGMGMFMPFPMGMGGGGGGGAAAEGGVAEGAAMGGLGSLGEESGPGGMSTGDDEFGIGRDSGVGENAGEAGGWGTGNDDALMQDDAPMVDPWASEPQAGGGDEGTWSWGDLFPDE